MPQTRYSSDEIVRRGQALYDQRIRARLEPGDDGKFVAVDIETGDFEVAPDELTASKQVQARHPEAAICLLRVGHASAYRIGGKRLVSP